MWWGGSDGRADEMAVGYLPVCVFLSRTQLFCSEFWVKFYSWLKVRIQHVPVAVFIYN